MSSGTMIMMKRQHGDRWSSFGEHAGILAISEIMLPSELKRFEIFQEFDDEFLAEISPDVTMAKWKAGAVVFEAGTYLDLAFFIVDGEVDMTLARNDAANQPIFTAREGPAQDKSGERPTPAAVRKPPGGRTIQFLAAADYEIAPGEKMRLKPGELFGEIGAMNGWPQSVTARTYTPCKLIQIRVPALRRLRRKSKKLKKRLDDLYKSRALRQHLTSTPVLEGCASDVIDELAAHVELISAQPGDVVTREGEPVDNMVLVRSGSLKMTQAVGAGEVVVSYVSKGATVGEVELLVDDDGQWHVTTTSVGYSELVQIPRAAFLSVVQRHPDLEKRLWGRATSRIKEIGLRRTNLERADVLDFALAKGLTQANSFLVMDLELCTRCDDCVRACASTHNDIPRFVREGEIFKGFMVARSCYHCQDPTCLVGCPTGAISRINIGAVVNIDPVVCIGCGACAENCQYDAIVMHALGKNWGPDAIPEHLRGTPQEVASKCDLCHTSPQGPACVSSCPHGAAHRVAGAEEFDVLLEFKRRGAVAK